ncbi:MAG: DUF86 domain-containing protein [Candidatus Freyarchaeum deiterrae]
MVRTEILMIKMKETEESLKLVEENMPKDLKSFLKLGLVKDGIYKRIEFCIQNILDICAVINSDLKLGVPSNEDNIVENLVKKGILSGKTGEIVKGFKGFRNFLVHRYGGIDDSIAFESIVKGLKDFSKVLKEIKEFLKSPPEK